MQSPNRHRLCYSVTVLNFATRVFITRNRVSCSTWLVIQSMETFKTRVMKQLEMLKEVGEKMGKMDEIITWLDGLDRKFTT